MSFDGFDAGFFEFFRELKQNNNRPWFEDNKDHYRQHVLEPGKAFVTAMGEALSVISQDIVYDTRSNGSGSIFRIYRDTRFSKDKTPYKTHMGILFWEGPHKKMECPGFYMHCDQDGVQPHCGLYGFSKNMLARYRDAVNEDVSGTQVAEIVANLEAKGYPIRGAHYKKVPRGYAQDHPRAELMKHNRLFTAGSVIPKEAAGSAALIEQCLKQCHDMATLHHWLTALQAVSLG